MTTIAISSLPVAVSQASADVLPIVQAATSTTKQLSVLNLFTNSALIYRFVSPELTRSQLSPLSVDLKIPLPFVPAKILVSFIANE